MKIKEIFETLLLQNQRAPNPEGFNFFQFRRGPSPEGSCFHKTGGVPIRGVLYLLTQRGPSPEGSKFCQSGGVSILAIRRGPIFANPAGYYFIKGLR